MLVGKYISQNNPNILKTSAIILLSFLFSISDSFGQSFLDHTNNKLNPKFDRILHDDLVYQHKMTTIVDENSSGIIYFVAAESIILGYSLLSRYTWGAYFTGGSFAGASAVMIGMLAFSDIDMNPGFTIPYTIGLSALAYYNLRFADSHSMTRKFWTNAIGMKTALIGSFMIGGIITRENTSDNRIQIESGLSTLKLTYRF